MTVQSTKYKVYRRTSGGQALVIVLLSLSVVLTLVLFILSRSITDIAVTTTDEQSLRAFSAAEAGVENALIGSGTASKNIGTASYTTTVSNAALGVTDFVYPVAINSGDTATLWFESHDANDNLVCDATHPCFSGTSLQVCWGNYGTSGSLSTSPAIEVSTYYSNTVPIVNYSTVKIARTASDPNSARGNNFSAASLGCTLNSSEQYAFSTTINFASLGITSNMVNGGLQFATVRMLYNNVPQKIGFHVVGGTLPSQGNLIDSNGSAGDANRRISVFQGWPEVPTIFMNALYSPNAISE